MAPLFAGSLNTKHNLVDVAPTLGQYHLPLVDFTPCGYRISRGTLAWTFV